MLAIQITEVLGSSVLGFLLGVCIGIALGYIVWGINNEQ